MYVVARVFWVFARALLGNSYISVCLGNTNSGNLAALIL